MKGRILANGGLDMLVDLVTTSTKEQVPFMAAKTLVMLGIDAPHVNTRVVRSVLNYLVRAVMAISANAPLSRYDELGLLGVFARGDAHKITIINKPGLIECLATMVWHLANANPLVARKERNQLFARGVGALKCLVVLSSHEKCQRDLLHRGAVSAMAALVISLNKEASVEKDSVRKAPVCRKLSLAGDMVFDSVVDNPGTTDATQGHYNNRGSQFSMTGEQHTENNHDTLMRNTPHHHSALQGHSSATPLGSAQPLYEAPNSSGSLHRPDANDPYNIVDNNNMTLSELKLQAVVGLTNCSIVCRQSYEARRLYAHSGALHALWSAALWKPSAAIEFYITCSLITLARARKRKTQRTASKTGGLFPHLPPELNKKSASLSKSGSPACIKGKNTKRNYGNDWKSLSVRSPGSRGDVHASTGDAPSMSATSEASNTALNTSMPTHSSNIEMSVKRSQTRNESANMEKDTQTKANASAQTQAQTHTDTEDGIHVSDANKLSASQSIKRVGSQEPLYTSNAQMNSADEELTHATSEHVLASLCKDKGTGTQAHGGDVEEGAHGNKFLQPRTHTSTHAQTHIKRGDSQSSLPVNGGSQSLLLGGDSVQMASLENGITIAQTRVNEDTHQTRVQSLATKRYPEDHPTDVPGAPSPPLSTQSSTGDMPDKLTNSDIPKSTSPKPSSVKRTNSTSNGSEEISIGDVTTVYAQHMQLNRQRTTGGIKGTLLLGDEEEKPKWMELSEIDKTNNMFLSADGLEIKYHTVHTDHKFKHIQNQFPFSPFADSKR
ncbi:hypothetical protein SARC_04477 [Sphaeroforma arctica JP610]|uniref:Uncharacterized protein n=1 Tax=Sphaeroforma arctica JP610 TaxID=667725 RepID=A0A0L0G345_9EUKA|nr:hypothetical protein SARC_04477 [Sphaeroforma arctica JP610]KNC83261.1 hypothetical protein SARC_04477 [Sphaeroforma arctica JP610]|eukprot:XP_014157163.1 hypothetical protein SARC_04477 [Sphaeroforma arctica JP610]